MPKKDLSDWIGGAASPSGAPAPSPTKPLDASTLLARSPALRQDDQYFPGFECDSPQPQINMRASEDFPATFVRYAADILGDTEHGLSGANIISATAAYAAEYEVVLPHPAYPFLASNKRTALYENLMVFAPPQRYRIIKELCDHPSFELVPSEKRKQLKMRLVTRYAHLDAHDSLSEINETLVDETRHWLQHYPEVLSLFTQALEKYSHGIFGRNLLDDLRLSLEKLLRLVLRNNKSLENQVPLVGAHIKAHGGSPELANMFAKLLDYYAKYHNNYIKHDDAVNEIEIEFLIELTSSFMKHLVRLSAHT